MGVSAELKRIAVLCSGSGTNLQALIDAEGAGKLGGGSIALVVASKSGIVALERAATHGIASVIMDKRNYDNNEIFDKNLCNYLKQEKIDLIVTAGYMQILGQQVLSTYEGRIVNVHPSLIPSFCGKGFYGLRVHRAALDYGVKITGATVHIVNEIVDGGRILSQKAVEIKPNDTPETLQKRVMEEAEWVILPQAVAELCNSL